MYLSVNEIMTVPKNNRAEKFLLPSSDLTANTNTCYYCVTAASDVPYITGCVVKARQHSLYHTVPDHKLSLLDSASPPAFRKQWNCPTPHLWQHSPSQHSSQLPTMDPAYLSVDQGVVEEDEPVHGEPARVLQRQRPVTALTQQSALRLPKGVLRGTTQSVSRQHHTVACARESELGSRRI